MGDIPAEALLAGHDASVEIPYPLYEIIWEEEQIPEDLKEGYLVNIHKKGDLSSCATCRGITLLSVPAKALNRILLGRMKNIIDPHIREEQTGFQTE